MDQQKNKTKLPVENRRRVSIILAGFAILLVAVFAATLLSSQLGHKKQSSVATVIRITKNGFQPATVSVKQGTKITWTNTEQTLHQVAANPFPTGADLPGLKSIILNNNQTYTYVANTTGTFGYHDQMAPTTNGTLIVEKQ